MSNKHFLRNNPKKIAEHTFTIEKNGYSCEEVDHLLDSVINDYISFEKVIDATDVEMKNIKNNFDKTFNQLKNVENHTSTLEHKLKEDKSEIISNNNISILQRLSTVEKNVTDIKELLLKISSKISNNN